MTFILVARLKYTVLISNTLSDPFSARSGNFLTKYKNIVLCTKFINLNNFTFSFDEYKIYKNDVRNHTTSLLK